MTGKITLFLCMIKKEYHRLYIFANSDLDWKMDTVYNSHMDFLKSYKKLLTEEVAFKSISASDMYKDDINHLVRWLKNQFTSRGFSVSLIEGYGNPFIIAKYISDPLQQTCLIYGHYDVQPATKKEGWNTDPFVLTEKDNRLYGRGSMDNKGQHLIHMITLFELIEKKNLGYNITFLLEGNEESGSPHLEKFINDKKDILGCDVILISDGEITAGLPTIEVGFRGNVNATLTIKTAENDLHSGLYGGAAPNAIHEAGKLIHSFFDEFHKVTIEGFYDGVDPLPSPTKIPFSMENYKKNTTTKALLNRPEYDFYTQVGLLPSLEITGIQSGYTGAGYRNSIPGMATVKINIRIVMSQTPQEMAEVLRAHVKKMLPSYVSFTLVVGEDTKGIKLSLDNPFIQKAKHLLQKIYGTEPVYRYVGGSIPIVTYFETLLHKPQLMIPMANEDGMMHGMNENFELSHVERAFEFSHEFFKRY